MPFPHNSQTYYEYFEEIAMQHVDLLHDPIRENKAVAFGEIYISSDPFDKIDLSSFMRDRKSVIKYPLLLIVGTDWDAAGRSSSQTNPVINASFIVLDKPDKTEASHADQRRAAYVKAEQICGDIIGFLKADFAANPTLGTLLIDTIKAEKIGPLDDQTYGVKVNWSFINRYTNFCFKQDRFLVLAPAAHSMPDLCGEGEDPEYCDSFIGRLSAQQRACLAIELIDGGEVGEEYPGVIGVFDGGTP